MTRQEEINNASNQLSESFKCSKIFKMGFEAGAMWADVNPKSPWISVKDSFPYDNPNNIHFGFTNIVFATDGKDVFIAYMKKDKDDKWTWYSGDNNIDSIIYWMFIPELPK